MLQCRIIKPWQQENASWDSEWSMGPPTGRRPRAVVSTVDRMFIRVVVCQIHPPHSFYSGKYRNTDKVARSRRALGRHEKIQRFTADCRHRWDGGCVFNVQTLMLTRREKTNFDLVLCVFFLRETDYEWRAAADKRHPSGSSQRYENKWPWTCVRSEVMEEW